MKHSLAFVLLGLSLVLPACGRTEESPPVTTAPQVCIPGQQVACACVGGLPGAQSCKADGSGLGECLCGSGGAGGAGGAAGQASSGAGGAGPQGGVAGQSSGGTAGKGGAGAGGAVGQAGGAAGGAPGQGGAVSGGGAAGAGGGENAGTAGTGEAGQGGAAGQAAGGQAGAGAGGTTLTCPTEPIVISPYPDPSDLTKKKVNALDPHPEAPFVLDGLAWASDPAALAGASWSWSVAGRSCDAILPHPTFALFDGPVVAQAKRIGSEATGLGADGKRRGLATTPTAGQHQIWPAFTLSGDYQVRGEVTVGGETLGCDVTLRVASPGLRAELCWVMQGDFTGASSSDLDLHFARLQGNASCDKKHSWFKGCGDAPAADDCFYDCGSGCRTGNTGFCAGMAAPAPGWGYAPSATDACHGWGSLREGQQSCDNPRLDRDNLGCNTGLTDPGTLPTTLDNPLNDFCGAENINLDQPAAGDQFLVGVHFYSGDKQIPHVNVFCDGHEVLSAGFDPTLNSSPFPVVSTAFNPTMSETFFKGDFWSVARIEWAADGVNPCVAEPITSKQPTPAKDGPAAYCVDTNAQNKPTPTMDDSWLFTPGGGEPRAPGVPASAACWH